MLAGAASLALGIAAVATTGLDGPLSQPVDEVLGWNHTALLGIIEIGAGVVMILSGLRAGARWLGGLVGLAAIVGGALILGRLDWTMNELGAERDFGWVAIAIGAAAVIGAAIPRVRAARGGSSQTQSSQLLTHYIVAARRGPAPGSGPGPVAPGRLSSARPPRDRGPWATTTCMVRWRRGWEGVPDVLRASLERGDDVGASVLRVPPRRARRRHRRRHVHPRRRRLRPLDPAAGVQHDEGDHGHRGGDLRRRGLIDYDAPVTAYWPEFAAAGKGEATVAQLLSHQLGLVTVDGLTLEQALDWDTDHDARSPPPHPSGRSAAGTATTP